MEGRIESIFLEDFITYHRLKFICDKNLNVIIGPNGTGKSTIVCAMVLGLGGKPKCLGRASSLSSFIRANCNAARIEIELYNPNGQNYVITRQITQDSKSSWLLRGEVTTQKEIESLVARLNIQVDNLCQFLPQERVADFSKMNGQQLLENTEKCVGPPEMIGQHEKLKELRLKHLDIERSKSNLNVRLQNEEQKNNRLAVDVDNITEKKNLLETVKKMKQKRAWLKYDNKRREIVNRKNDKDKALKNLKKYKTTYEPMEKSISSTKAQIKAIEQDLQNLDQEMRKRLSAVTGLQDRLESTEDRIKQNIEDCDNKLQIEQQRRREVNTLLQQIDKLKNDIKSVNKESETAIHEQMKIIGHQMNEKLSQKNDLRNVRERLQNELEIICQNIQAIEKEKQKVIDVTKQRLQLVQRQKKDVYEAILWLRENRHRFRHQIYEPMILEINVTNTLNAKYVEAMIPARDLFAFTCEDKQDMNEFLRLVREEKNLRVSALHSGPEQPPLSSFRPNTDISKLRMYGFHSYLSEMFTAPDLIMRYLCRMYKLHNIPVGDDKTYKLSEKVSESVSCFFSEDNSFYVSRSKYSGFKSLRINELHSPYLLAISVNTQLLEGLEKRLQTLNEEKVDKMKSLERIQIDMHRFENELEALRSKRKELNGHLERQRSIQAKLAATENQLAKLERSKVNTDLEKIKCCKENQKLILYMSQQTADLLQLLKRYDQSLIESKILQQELKTVREELIHKENESHELLQKYEQAQKLLLDIDQVIKSYKNEAVKLYDAAKDMTEGIAPRDPEFTAFKQSFNFFPESEDDLDREIQDSQAKADCLGESDDTVMNEYKTRQIQIASLKGNMESREQECKRIKEEMDSLREQWLLPLKTLVSQINRKYGECFARLQCAGDVSLVPGDNEDDYAQYGLKIKVKFRDGEQLQELTQHLQSGGERAVATAIYMIALQEITRVPFCCVDEINQGMDAVNERMIFELLVTTTRQSGTQYFLLTPKLIPALLYDKGISVHCVYNGSGVCMSKHCQLVEIVKKKMLKNMTG